MSDQRMSLYEIGIEGQEIELLLTENLGEITPEIEARMDALLAGGPDKMDAAAAVWERLENQMNFCKRKADEYAAKAGRFERDMKGLEARMQYALTNAFNGNLRTPSHNYWLGKSAGSTTIEVAADADLISLEKEDAEVVKHTRSLDTATIRNRLKLGLPIPNAVKIESFPGTKYLMFK